MNCVQVHINLKSILEQSSWPETRKEKTAQPVEGKLKSDDVNKEIDSVKKK